MLEDIFLKLYISVFSLTNFSYVFLEVIKSRYIDDNSLKAGMDQYHFEYISNLSSIASKLELFMLAIFLIYFLALSFKKSQVQIKKLIITNVILCTSLFFINSLISFIFAAPTGNLNQQLILPSMITLLLLVGLLVITLYKKFIKV